jgi:hypothetical protein
LTWHFAQRPAEVESGGPQLFSLIFRGALCPPPNIA